MTKESTSLIIIGIVILIGLFIHFFNPASPTPNQKACPSDLQLCPSGEYVGRILPDCDFLECKLSQETASTTTSE